MHGSTDVKFIIVGLISTSVNTCFGRGMISYRQFLIGSEFTIMILTHLFPYNFNSWHCCIILRINSIDIPTVSVFP